MVRGEAVKPLRAGGEKIKKGIDNRRELRYNKDEVKERSCYND